MTAPVSFIASSESLEYVILTFINNTVNSTELVLEALFEIFKSQHDNSYIVKRFVGNTRFHYLFDDIAAGLVDLLVLRVETLFSGDPALF